MKKYVLAVMVALIAVSVASSASADDGRKFGEGQWKKMFKWEKHEREDEDDDRDDDRKEERKEERKDKKNKNVFGECGMQARQAMGADMKDAFTAFMDAKKEARDDRTQAIVDANGDQAKIVKAWESYQTAFLAAWKTYSNASFESMSGYGSAFAKCKITLNASATSTPSTTPLPVYSLATVATHNTSASCWGVVSGKVYNLTSYIPKHPGGQSAIKSLCGVDATSSFTGQHGGQSVPVSTLTKYLIGTL